MPCVLSRKKSAQVSKQIVVGAQASLAVAFTILKSLAMIKINGSPIIELNGLSDDLKKILGLQSDQKLSIVLIDVTWLLFAAFLLWCYTD